MKKKEKKVSNGTKKKNPATKKQKKKITPVDEVVQFVVEWANHGGISPNRNLTYKPCYVCQLDAKSALDAYLKWKLYPLLEEKR